jgi:hypothetical protein
MNNLRDTVFPPFFNGDGSDGDIRFSLSNVLTSSKMYNSVYMPSGSILGTVSHRLYVKSLLRIAGTAHLNADGTNANFSTSGAGVITNELGGGGDGGTSQNIGTPDIVALDSPTYGSLGGSGGTGITAGGQANFISNLGSIDPWLRNFQAMYSGLLYYPSGTYFGVVQIISGGGGGGTGAGVANRGGSGGGGGGVLWLAADTIWLESGAILSANGGNGGNATPGGSGAGGGSGGGGGAILLFCNRFINEGATIQAIGGTGGTGVNGGSSGGNGSNGNVVIFTPQGITVT